MKIEDILKIINSASTLMPDLVKLLKLFLTANPDTPVGELQAQAQNLFDENKKIAEDWLAAHPE